MQTMKAMRRRQAGMSLIEVLTSLLIFSIGILGLVGLQTQAIQFSANAEDTNRAALLASDLVAKMWVQQLTADDVTQWQKRVADSELGLPNGTGTVEQVDGGVTQITITWRSPRSPKGSENRYVTQVVIPS
jgi:type IV pilus assembly protein PilV